MSLPWQAEPLEPERYELAEPPRWHLDLERRDFMQALGGGIAVLFLLPAPARAATGAIPTAASSGQEPATTIGAWLHVAGNGAITVFTGKVEVGQDIRTSLAQAVAEELRVGIERIELVMGDTDRVPYDRGTFGSRTTPAMAPQLRAAAAALREWLLDLAAAELGVARDGLRAVSGRVVHGGSGRTVGYGELVAGKDLARRIVGAPLQPVAQWEVAGRSVPKVNGRALVTGAHRFPSDITRPGLLHGKVLRPPAFGARLQDLDARAAKAMPGVEVVRDGDFAGVVAPTQHAAARALQALVATWAVPAAPDEAQLGELLRRPAARGARGERGNRGEPARADLDAAWQACAHRVAATFTVPYIAHAPLEPRAAVAEWNDGRLTVWTGTQRPFGVRDELVAALRLETDQVRVLVPDTGSGYGGKHTADAAVEAALLARAAKRPVRVAWTREEEFTWAYFRPAGVLDVRAGADADGRLVAWEFHNHNSGTAALAAPYAVPARREQFHAADSPLRQGSYRALAATANHFARESAIDDLANEIGLDPLAFRRRNLQDERLLAVLDAATRGAGWAQALPAGVGRGLACGTDKGSYVATVADVRVDAAARRIEVLRLVTAFECGALVNPDHTRNQVEGAIVQGLGGALFEAIRFGQGRIHNPRFSQYRVPRCLDVPELVTVLLDRKDLPPAGAGETPIVGVAPAIRNAIAAGSGQRLCELPLRLA